MDVAIVGIGIHPFGRTPARSGLQQGAYAARLALKDAGIEWRDIQFAFGGSASAGSADALVNEQRLFGGTVASEAGIEGMKASQSRFDAGESVRDVYGGPIGR